MRSITCLVVFLVLISSLTCVGDQLQWNTLEVCERAAQEIRRQPILVSYCSLADAEYVEVWLVKRVDVVNTPTDGLFEVSIVAKRLYRSKKLIPSAKYREPVDYRQVPAEGGSEWFVQGIDLAYVYIQTGENAFRALGKVLELECLVELETINLSDDLMNKITNNKMTVNRALPVAAPSQR